jgi:hypothetical protein
MDGTGASGTVTLAPIPSQQGYVTVKAGDMTARARVRVAPGIPFKQDFEKLPDGASPGGWVNANGKFSVKKLADGNLVLSKVNTNPRPPLAKANGYITLPDSTGYTISADLMGTQVRGGMADFGLINCRYNLVLDGKTDPDVKSRTLKLTSWDARPRIDERLPFNWEPGVWYSAKLAVEQKEKSALVRGKVWKKGTPEPDKWTIEFEDSGPNREGSAGVYGYVTNSSVSEPGSEAFYDNIVIAPNSKK